MKYEDTERTIRVGDKVTYHGQPGIIVFVIDDDGYSTRFDRDTWAPLGKGLGIEVDDGTLYHLDTPDEDLEPAD